MIAVPVKTDTFSPARLEQYERLPLYREAIDWSRYEADVTALEIYEESGGPYYRAERPVSGAVWR